VAICSVGSRDLSSAARFPIPIPTKDVSVIMGPSRIPELDRMDHLPFASRSITPK
jgi:hypothetical protein